MTVAHPAKFTDVLIDEIARQIITRYPTGVVRILDPFAGTGRIHLLRDSIGERAETTGVEIEPEWAGMHPHNIVADALDLPFGDQTFDVIATSPVYGNRMSDHHNAKDGSRRMTYRHTLGRALHPNNSGQLQWGAKYRSFHEQAWAECVCVLRDGGLFLLNCSDHIRAGERQRVTDWHVKTLQELGLTLIERIEVPTPRMRRGENHALRVEYEEIVVLNA